MAYGKTIEDYENQIYEMENILYKLEKGEIYIHMLSLNEICLFDFDNILFDIENLTFEDIDSLSLEEENDDRIIEFNNLLNKFYKLQDRFLECAYKEGEINIIDREYLYKGQNHQLMNC